MNTTTDYFNTICKITSAIGTTSRYEDLLDLIVTSAVDAMKGKGAALFLPSDDNDYFVSVANTGLSKNYQHANPMRVKPIIDSVLKEGGYLAVRNATSDPKIPNHQAKKEEGIASLLSVPVMVKGDIRGVLTLYTSDERDFSEKEIRLLKTLAEQGGLAIERSRLITGVLTYAKLFKKISENLNSSLEIKTILNTLTCDICAALEMKGALIRLKDEDTGELKLVASCGLSDAFLQKGPVYSNEGFAKVLGGETLVAEDVT
ncbi:MAG: GAF domain-containing protein, partial [Desulfobacteraceae bacterium]|nr:GAF domain-containing protein [Desulfobacteraceae bacterium]